MTKRKKVRKYRGSKTHGGGSMKKRRGAGSRGGRGRAGSGKRGDSRKPSYWKDDDFGAGQKGFTPKNVTELQALNVSDVEKKLSTFVDEGIASQSKGSFTVDLAKAGIDKLLGSGQVSTKMDISVKQATPSAIAKVEDAGGSVELMGERKEKKAKSDTSKPKDADEDEGADDEE